MFPKKHKLNDLNRNQSLIYLYPCLKFIFHVQVICKERGLGLGLLNDRDHSDVLPLREVAARVNRGTLVRQDENLVKIPPFFGFPSRCHFLIIL